METEVNPTQKRRKRSKKMSGNRCVVAGCNNTSGTGFSVYQLPGKMPIGTQQFTPLQRSWIRFIQASRANFQPETYNKIHVCSGHFDQSQFHSSHIQMYRTGLRKQPPTLLPDAVPHRKQAINPFPQDWFQPIHVSSATTATPTEPPPPVSTAIMMPAMETVAEILSKKRRTSLYTRGKELAPILEEVAERERMEEEERAKDFLNQSKAAQCTVKMVDHQVQTRVRRRSAAVTAEPKSVSIGMIPRRKAYDDYLQPHLCKYCRQQFFHNTGRFLNHLRHHELRIRKYWYGYNKARRIPESERIIDDNDILICQFDPAGVAEIYTDTSAAVVWFRSYDAHNPPKLRYNITSDDSRKLKRHERVHTKERPYQCKYCQKGFAQSYTLKCHERIHTKEKPYECKYCQREFAHSSALRCHERIHTKEKPYHCKYCEKTFARLSTLQHHERTHTKEKPYKCEYCQKDFTQASDLTRHERRHTKEKPYQCKFCQRDFADSSALIRHERIHTKDKPYKCKYCPKEFCQSGTLTRHERTHTKEKPYQCKYCPKDFVDSSALKRHERIHTKEKPYECKYCQKGFAESGQLKRHERIHLKENPYYNF